MLGHDVGYCGREAEGGEVDGAGAGVVGAPDGGLLEGGGGGKEGDGEELPDVVEERRDDGGVVASWGRVSGVLCWQCVSSELGCTDRLLRPSVRLAGCARVVRLTRRCSRPEHFRRRA